MIAELFDGGDEGKPRCTLHTAPETKQETARKAGTSPASTEEDWEGDLEQLNAALTSGHAEPIGWYLRDAAEILGRSARALSPDQTSRGWRLKFCRQGRGRRSDRFERMIMETGIRAAMAFAKARGIKQESVVAELEERFGVSRATIFL